MFGKLTLTLRVTFHKKLLIKTAPQHAGETALIPPPTSLPVMKSSMLERVSAVFTLTGFLVSELRLGKNAHSSPGAFQSPPCLRTDHSGGGVKGRMGRGLKRLTGDPVNINELSAPGFIYFSATY